MYIKYKPVAVFWHILIFVSCVIALFDSSEFTSGNIQFKFQFFEYDICILTACYYFILSCWQLGSSSDKSSLWIGFKYVLMMNLWLIFLVALIVINNGRLPEDADIKFVFSHFTVYLLPFLILIDWLLFDSKGNFKNSFLLFACIPSALYVFIVYILKAIGDVRGFEGYPYFFMNLSDEDKVLHFSLMAAILIAFIVL